MQPVFLKQSIDSLKCYHCGDSCNGSIISAEHVFCCEGCKTVYEILNENNLCGYYQLNQSPGHPLKNASSLQRFEFLDDPDVIGQLIRFSHKNTSTVTFYVPKIHCSSCIYLLENLYKLKEGVSKSNVNFLKKEVQITFDNSLISLRQVVETMVRIGYEPYINLNDLSSEKTINPNRSYYLKIGIAFFCFGNIMLLSFPEYLGIDALTESPMRQFFGYLNFILSLPVVLFCAQEFYLSAWSALRQKSLNMDIPIVLGISAMFIRSSYEIFSGTGAGYFDTLTSLVMLMLIGRLFQNKSYDTLSFERDYKSYFPVSVSVKKEGTETTIPLTKVKLKDWIVVRNQELIPADAVLLSDGAQVDYSFVTGESEPVQVSRGELIYAGGRLAGKSAELQVVKEVKQSYLTQLWNHDAFKKEEGRNVSSLASEASKWFTPIVVSIAVLSMIYWWNKDIHRALNAFTSVLIITCPCALALSSPFALGNVMRLLSRSGVYLKNTSVIENLAKVKAIVFDKTGTLTSTKQSKIDFINESGELSVREKQLVKSIGHHSSHPLSKRIYRSLSEVDVLPTSDFVEHHGLGIEGWVDETFVKVGSYRFIFGDSDAATKETEADFQASRVYVSIDSKPLGYFVVHNAYRNGFEELISKLKSSYDLFVLSGDNDAERGFLEKFISKENMVFHQKPQDKLNKVKQIQSDFSDGKVLMIGDGLNDAGALKQADIGIAVSDDINNFSPACDAIIEADKFSKIDKVIEYARTGVIIVKVSFVISIIYNFIGLYFAVQGTMSPLVAAVLMPISSVTIIAFTTISASILAKRQGF